MPRKHGRGTRITPRRSTKPAMKQVDMVVSLKDYFAAAALTGLLAGNHPESPWPQAVDVASLAYSYADAMLNERKPHETNRKAPAEASG